MRTKYILSFTFLLFLCGCSRPQQSSPAITNTQFAPAPETKIQKSSCDIMLEALEKDSNLKVAPSDTIRVSRLFQRIIRKDCSDNIVSDKIETVKSPTFKLEVSPILNRPFKSVLVYNQPSCDHKLTSMPIANTFLLGELYNVTGDGKKRIQIKADLSDALLTFKFSEGENKLFVRYFYDCSPDDFAGNRNATIGQYDCSESKDYQTVLYSRSVIYSEETLAGSETIVATDDECKLKK